MMGGSKVVSTWALFCSWIVTKCEFGMPGKKKKGKAKGKGGGGDGTLPPPPNLDDTRQGALEALLKFR